MDDPNAILCAYPVNNCVMKFTYSELASGKSNLTVLKEPGWLPLGLLLIAQAASGEVMGCWGAWQVVETLISLAAERHA